MNLPMPSDASVTKFIDYYRKKTGTTLDRATAFREYSRVLQYIYLTEYYPTKPLREQGPSSDRAGLLRAARAASRKARREADARRSATRLASRERELDHEAWYRKLGSEDRDIL